jgi:hypothetical protein
VGVRINEQLLLELLIVMRLPLMLQLAHLPHILQSTAQVFINLVCGCNGCCIEQRIQVILLPQFLEEITLLRDVIIDHYRGLHIIVFVVHVHIHVVVGLLI